ncbi:hypothetical protein Tco_1543265 [Tanacetum coccineum]
MRFYQNDDTSPWGNSKCKEKGEDVPEWTIRSRFEDELANFMHEKKSHTKGIGEMLDQHRNTYGVIFEEEAKKGAILELKRRNLKNTIFCTYTPYPAMKIRRINASSAQEMRNDQFLIWRIHYNQYAVCTAVH